ncbi:ATPase [Calothrix sp. 336/3]|nr:ATPase [Calothrix sp. 336/3]
MLRNWALHSSLLISLTVALTLILFIPQTLVTCQAYYQFNHIIENELKLQTLTSQITYLDELLTMSAKMNAATGDRNWEKRYREHEPLLDKAIKELINLAPQTYNSEDAKQTDAANLRLVEIESQSFDLVRNNQKDLANQLLSSSEYINQKQKYASGVEKRNIAIAIQMKNAVSQYQENLLWSIIVSGSSLVLLMPCWILVLRLLKTHLHARKLAQIELENNNQELENKIYLRTEELQKNNLQLRETLEELQQTQAHLVQAEKMSSLGQMVAGIAHEINNPVNFIYGNITHVQEYTDELMMLIRLYQEHYTQPPENIENSIQSIDLEFLSQDLPEVLASMKMGTERIKNIVVSLRNFSRLDEAAVKEVNIHEGIDSTLMILEHRLKANNQRPAISIIKEYALLPLVECYPSQLNQVFMNIIANAIDALDESNSERDYHEIKSQPNQIKIVTQVISQDWIRIKIADNGMGIPEAILKKLFDPFFTTKAVGKGTGLGLSISYQIIVNKHGGNIYCNSQLNQGTTFVIEIPINRCE